MTKRIIVVGCLTLMLLAGISFSILKQTNTNSIPSMDVNGSVTKDASSSVGRQTISKIDYSKFPVVYVGGPEALTTYSSNLNNAENLVGGSHNIFVGKVVPGSIRQKEESSHNMQFDVDVKMNIKGNIQGRTTVNIMAWYYNEEIRVVRGNVFPKEGATYLFATRYNTQNNWYTLVLFYTEGDVSWKLISDDSTLTTAQLLQLAQNDPRVKQLQAAYPKEVLDKADVYHNNTLNSYQSLTEAQKAALPYYTGSYGKAVTSTATSTQ